jgi:hypothetical protein
MATSGSNTFTLPLDELLEEAIAPIGGDPILGGEARRARRALNLLFIDMQNRGILLHTLEQAQVTLAGSVAQVTCSSNCLDIIDLVISTSSQDVAIDRISWGEYLEIPNKTQVGRPTHYFVDRQRDAPILSFWPVPTSTSSTVYVAKYWKVRFIEDATKLGEDPDMPRRFWPALVAGLSYYLAKGRGMAFPMDRLAVLKQDYLDAFDAAMGEDRERVSFFAVPSLKRHH